ncbi:unnamed protein product [Mytilus coruscus]|uniref:DDE Tnp4 domain-containing protein n=1 Tax=Mytilus coruscus TaxID=42192 RepID=A0A6J8C4K4_MYTCO|nr:unnamed protein product [Mytilus coruscus]
MKAEATLSDYSKQILTTPDDSNVPYNKPVKWSNNNKWKFLELDFSLKYHTFERPPKPDPTGETHFVTHFKYDIVKAVLQIEHRRKGVSLKNYRQLNCRNGLHYPTYHIADCGKRKEFNIESWRFQHADTLTITCTAENGGFLKYIDRETDYNNPRYIRLKGKAVHSSFAFRWDYIKPYQECIKGSKTDCNQPPVDCKDLSKQPDIKVEWGGWKDDLSGIDHFELELYELVSTGRQLDHIIGPAVHRYEKISVQTSEQIIKLPKPGLYSMILTSSDKARNQLSARCLVFYDDISVVDIKRTKRIKVNTASAKTNYTWVSVDDLIISVTWKDRFLNERHEKHSWLHGVGTSVGVQEEYDDLYGPRNVSPIENIHGIVKFEIKYEVYGPYLKANQSLTQTANVLNQAEYLNITWEDGYRLDITVRAFDILNEYKDDVLSVYKDVSSPVIQNLWLTKGDRVNKSVYSMEDFSKMTIEWDAFDYDSGLDLVEWRIYNNSTRLEEQATTMAQGKAGNLNDCIKQYGSTPRGSSCYCTMFHGCYHKHFQIRPNIVKYSEIKPGKEKGLYDSDYYIEVTATNKALLKTKKTLQITLDLSPPHEGYVHDGIKGDQEVDFQQDAQLYAYWEGFLDEESGIDFYQYIFSDKCFNETEMALSNEKQVTYNTSASYNASSDGIFFISVTAVNKAAESSKVVCSDGVTVTTTIPFIKDFVFEDMKARNQILKDHNDTWWLLDSNLIRHRITDLSGLSGYFLEMVHTNISFEAFPEGGPVDKINVVLQDTKSKSGILGVLPKSQSFQIEWKSGVKESLIHDYAIGISSSLDGMASNIYSFQSTNHHKNFRIVHDNLEVIGNFYILVKTTSQSGVVGNQSIGPFIVDISPPMFQNNVIKVCNINGYLFTSWPNDTVFDEEDPFPLQYEYAVGSTVSRQDVQSFTSIDSVGPCTAAYPPQCSAVLISDLQWPLHSNHDYYISLRVTNVLGMSSIKTSEPFRYVQLPTKGVIFDVPPDVLENKGIKEIIDVDFTCNRKTLGVVWSGFEHSHFNVIFHVCIGSKKDHCDINTGVARNSSYSFHVFKDLNLKDFQKYFITVKAEAATSTVSTSSDGVTLLDTTQLLSGIVVFDGTNCTGGRMNSSNGQQVTRTKTNKAWNFRIGGFPNVIGAINGTHVRIQAPTTDEASYFNRKGYHSTNVQPVCDADGKFTNINTSWPGNAHDAHIFRTSQVSTHMERTPNWESGILHGDSGLPCCPFIMTPYPHPANEDQTRFNRHHARTRCVIERTFWWKRRFHVLHSEIRMKPERVCIIIMDCAILHNIALWMNEPEPEDQVEEIPSINAVYNGANDGRRIMDHITQIYFTH